MQMLRRVLLVAAHREAAGRNLGQRHSFLTLQNLETEETEANGGKRHSGILG